MGSGYEETPKLIGKELPVPPPLPGPASTTSCHSRLSSIRVSCCASRSWDLLFEEAYRADVLIHTQNSNIIYAHASVLGVASPVFKAMLKLKQSRIRSISSSERRRTSPGPHSVSIRGVPHEAVRVFIRYLYSSCYEQEEMNEHVLSLLVLSHAFVVPRLKRECEYQLEKKLLNLENVIDVFQLALLCDAPRLSIIAHRLILKNFKVVSATEGWSAMKESHPMLEKELLTSVIDADNRQKDRIRKMNERRIYEQLYEAMEALVHICKDGCRAIGPHDRVLKEEQKPCNYEACKGLESLVRHFSGCKLRVPGDCKHCKRMWQLLELHSRLCADSDVCKVPFCRNIKQRVNKQRKKDDMMWRILVRKILRTKSITGAPYFSMASA